MQELDHDRLFPTYKAVRRNDRIEQSRAIADSDCSGLIVPTCQPAAVVEDGLVIQFQPLSHRDRAAVIIDTYGSDKGFDFPKAVDDTKAPRTFLNNYAMNPDFYLIVFTLDDTRTFCAIPASHDVARCLDCAYVATTIAMGRLDCADATEVARDPAHGLAKQAYRH